MYKEAPPTYSMQVPDDDHHQSGSGADKQAHGQNEGVEGHILVGVDARNGRVSRVEVAQPTGLEQVHARCLIVRLLGTVGGVFADSGYDRCQRHEQANHNTDRVDPMPLLGRQVGLGMERKHEDPEQNESVDDPPHDHLKDDVVEGHSYKQTNKQTNKQTH